MYPLFGYQEKKKKKKSKRKIKRRQLNTIMPCMHGCQNCDLDHEMPNLFLLMKCIDAFKFLLIYRFENIRHKKLF